MGREAMHQDGAESAGVIAARCAAGVGALAALTLGAGVARACPLCDSERAEVVRAGIREEADGATALGLLAPGAAAVALAAALWLWPSAGGAGGRGVDSAGPRGQERHT